MLLTTVINLCILFTFSVLLFLYARYRKVSTSKSIFYKVTIGIFSAVIGLVLIETSIRITAEVFIDTRTVPIILSGILGGPIALFTSGFLLGFIRMVMGGFTTISVITGMNTIICTIILIVLSRKLPLNLSNAKYFFNIMILQTTALLIWLIGFSLEMFFVSLYFIFFTNLSFYIVVQIMKKMDDHYHMVDAHKIMAETDNLTGLYNRRKFYHVLDDILTSEIQVFSMIMMDIDNFKQVNDTYGHLAGDRVLESFSQELKAFAKECEGTAFRYGGEEFLLVLPNQEKDTVIEAGEIFRNRVKRKVHNIHENIDIHITISSGASTYPEDGRTVEELYDKADYALNIAKKKGKNQFYHIEEIT